MAARPPWFVYKEGQSLSTGTADLGFLGDPSIHTVRAAFGTGIPYRRSISAGTPDHQIIRQGAIAGRYAPIGQLQGTSPLAANPFYVNTTVTGTQSQDEGA